MENKIKYASIAVSLLLAFAVGRYSGQKPAIKETTKTEDTKKSTTDTETHTVIVNNPDGSSVTTIDSHTKEKEHETSKSATVVAIEAVKSHVNIALLGGYDTKTNTQLIGAQVYKQMLGPVTIGAFGFNNGLVGLSVGVSF